MSDRPGWVQRLWRCMMAHKLELRIAVGAALLSSLSQTLVPLVERQIVDGVILKRTSALWPWLVILLGLAAASFGLTFLRRYFGGRLALKVQFDLRNAMHDHLQVMDFDNLSRMPTGQLVARANSDSTLVQGLLSFLPQMTGNVLMMILSLGVMFYLSPILAIVSAVVAPSLLVVSYRMRWRVFPATWDGQQREGDVAQIVDEDVNGVRVVKAFGQERRELERVVDASKRLYGSQMRAVRLQTRYQPLLEAIPSLGQVAVLALGGYLALRHEITIGTFLAFSTYIAQLVAPARMLAGVLTVGQQARAGVDRIFQLLDMPPKIADRKGASALTHVAGALDFDDVHFAYPDGTPVLEGFDLHVGAGERVAIVGASGSGKSTVALMLGRFFEPNSGRVLIDGHDVADITLGCLRREVGFVFEESFLFSDSVRSNIAYGKPDATDAEIESAARLAQAHDFITALPRGYDTVVGERGLTLSGGQRQRVALARTILYNPTILVLDDATSAIDAKVEAAIHEGLRMMTGGRTTILVAHRRSTLHLADRIVVIDKGVVAESGTPNELAETSALYRSLLSGMEADAEEQSKRDAIARGSIETLASHVRTESAWANEPAPVGNGSAATAQTGAPRTLGYRAPSLGAGLPGGGGGWRLNLAPTPELLARVDALPPIKDEAEIDLRREAAPQPGFSLRSLLSEFRRPLLLGLVFVVIDGLFSLAGPYLVKEGINNGVATGSESVLFIASAVFLVITLADLIDEIGETFVTGRAAQRIMLSLRIRIWAQLQRLSLDYYEREMAGRIMTRMTTDVDQFESLVENGLLSALVAIVTFVGVGVALVLLSPTLGLLTLTVAIPLAFATFFFRRAAARLYDQARERIAIVNADFQESLSGVRESQAFTHEAASNAHFHRLGQHYLDARIRAQRLVAMYFPFVQFLSGVADAIVLGVGASLVQHHSLTAGALIAYILYIDLFFSPIQQLSQVFDSWQQTRVSVRRISDLMQLETLTPIADDAVSPSRLLGDVDFEDVRFAYPSGFSRPIPEETTRGPRDTRALFSVDAALPTKPPEALRGVELEVHAGETVALVGETGAGKSTVVKLMARFYDPRSGTVSVDGTDLRRFDLEGFRHQLGYVPQEPFLFSGTIRDNIAYGRPQAGDAEVEASARAVGAHDLIAGLPGGYNHELAERGRSLSAGQRQLIALARAELVKPAVLLLDEATSQLDLVTEARVAAAMGALSAGRTTIVIAHRLQTAAAADRIIVMDQGRVVESGTHAELVARGDRYASMWRAFELVASEPA